LCGLLITGLPAVFFIHSSIGRYYGFELCLVGLFPDNSSGLRTQKRTDSHPCLSRTILCVIILHNLYFPAAAQPGFAAGLIESASLFSADVPVWV
jgi:hypothetical protein